MKEHGNYIGGQWTGASRKMSAVSPLTGSPFASVALSGEAEVNHAVAAAKGAFPAWSRLSLAERCSLVRKLSQWLNDQYGGEGVETEIKRAIMTAVGKPLPEADIEVLESAGMIEYFCDIAPHVLEPQEIRLNQTLWPTKESKLYFDPIGVVGVIKPWNYPLEMPVWAVAPALLSGNTVVLKPSEKSPTIGLLFGEMAEASGLPPGVLNVVNGDRATGQILVRHRDVGMISFTGSVSAGRWIATECGKQLKKLTLELGGNDAALVLEDADLELASNGLIWGAFCNAGQVCVGVKRAFVDEKIADKLVPIIVEKVRRLRPQVDVGPIIDEGQLRMIEDFVQDATRKGAKVLIGGKRIAERAGTFFEPTVLTGVDKSMRLMNEECFGPILPIMTVGSVDVAVRLANETSFGLGASVWTSDLSRGNSVARGLDSGMVWINDVNVAFAEAPWGGVKDSGQGFELSPDCLREYVVRKHVNTETSKETRRIWWYPYGS